MTPDELREELELKIVEYIKKALEEGILTEEKSQAMSSWALATLKPGMSFDELYRAIPKLDDTYPELSPIILPYLKEYEENVTKKARAAVSELIKQGAYDAAVKTAAKAINQDVNLVWQGSSSSSKLNLNR